MKKPYHFFYSHGGCCYDPKTETKQQGRARCAKTLAKAEANAREAGLRYVWSFDPDTDSTEFTDERYTLWRCFLVRGESEILQSLHGIDFGPVGHPWGQPYARVVEAELAAQQFQ